LEGVLDIIIFTFLILDPDVTKFGYDSLVGIDMVYLATKSQTPDTSRAVKWLIIVQYPILIFNESSIYDYIWIAFKCQSTNFLSPVLFNMGAN